jgi:DNA-binding transcriptional regulator YiaG
VTPTQFRSAIDKLGLSQERAGLWLGLSERAGQRYANGEAKIPGPVAKLLRLVIRLDLKPDEVR